MNFLNNLSKKRVTKDKFIAVIEISQGSKKKYELDKETGIIILDRFLTTAFRYPANYGFIPFTYSEDDDPLDVLVLTQDKLDSLVLVECFPIGVLKMVDQGALDEKIISIATKDVLFSHYKDIEDLPPHLLEEIKNFFEHYKSLENKTCSIQSISGRQEASAVIEKCLKNYYLRTQNKL